MKRFFDPRLLLCLLLPLLLAFHDNDDAKAIGNSAPPGAGGPGPFQAFNMEFLSNLTLAEIGSGGAGNVIGNDCWGWTDSLDGREYAICGLTNGTSFIDITNPTDPQYLGKLPTQTGNTSWRDMKVFSDHVFVVSDNNGPHGMQVFDLTQLRNVDPNNPQTFSSTAHYNGVSSAHNIAINEDTGYAYIVGSNQASGGLHVVNINNPTNPTTAGNFSADGYTHDAQVVTYLGPDSDYAGMEIAFASNEDTLTIVDVTNKNNMTLISRNNYAQDAYTHQCWLSEDHEYVYLGDELDESSFGGPTRTHIWNVADLDNPSYLGFYSGTTSVIDHNLYVKDNLIYLASYSAGLRVLEIDKNNPANLTEVAFLDTFGANDNVSFEGAWSTYPYFDSGTILINDRQGGMFLARLALVQFNFPDGLPAHIDPSGGVLFNVEIVEAFGSIEPGTALLHIDRGNGFETFPLNEISNDLYEVNFPTTACGTEVQYYFSVQTTAGATATDPSNAPTDVYVALSADSIDISFEDNFETDQGWTVTGNALDGQWDRGVPIGGGDRGDPPTDADGSGQCYLTDNEDGNSDVDQGSTILTSTVFDGSLPGAQISYYRWFSNDFGGAPNEDIFEVEISINGGSTWTHLETVGPGGPEASGGWYFKSFVISDFVAPTNNMQIRFIASDLGDGSIVEAGVDGVQVSSVACDANSATVPPSSINIFRGVLIGGTLGDVADSDDSYMLFNPGLVLNNAEAPVWLIFDANLPADSPASLELIMEAQAGTPGLTGTVEAWNWNTNAYDVLDVSAASFNSDAVITADLTAGIADYVQPGTAAVQTRTGWRKTGLTLNFPWEIRLDQLVWNVN